MLRVYHERLNAPKNKTEPYDNLKNCGYTSDEKRISGDEIELNGTLTPDRMERWFYELDAVGVFGVSGSMAGHVVRDFQEKLDFGDDDLNTADRIA